MFSDFIKKLMFTRKFYMNKGAIEILNRKHVLLSSSILSSLQNKTMYNEMKKVAQQDIHEYCNIFGSKRQDLIKNIENIFNMYGLGMLELKNVDFQKNDVKLCLYNSTIAHNNGFTEGCNCKMAAGILAGIFSYLFDNNIDCEEIKCYSKGDEYCEFILKKEEKQ